MFKKILCSLLAFLITFTAIPLDVFAKENVLFGDANNDGVVDLKDILIVKKYIAQQHVNQFNFLNADINSDKIIDEKDIILVKRYMAEVDIKLGPELTVCFYDGERLIDVLPAKKGEPLGSLPSSQRSSKEGYILEGYYSDEKFTQAFYDQDIVQTNLNVYAKYEQTENTEQLNITTFTLMDQTPNVSFKIYPKARVADYKNAATLVVKDGSDPVEIEITPLDNDTYIVKAKNGFNEGCSYELQLTDGWMFVGKEDTLKTAAFTIQMDQVVNLQMSDDIKYLKDTQNIDYQINSQKYFVLTSEELEQLENVTSTGTIQSSEILSNINKNDILCVYVGTHPNERNKDLESDEDDAELLDPAVYVKVKDISADLKTITFTPLDSEDQQKLYKVPDNFPIIVDSLPSGNGTVNFNQLDTSLYASVIGENTKVLETAKSNLDVGDFVTLYTSQDEAEKGNLFYGRVEKVDGDIITFKKSSESELDHCMDLYVDTTVQGDDLISDAQAKQIEEQLLDQVKNSNFGQEAVELLTDIAVRSDNFKENTTIQDFIFTDGYGNVLSDKEVQALNLSKKFQIKDGVDLTVELIRSGKQLHFGQGVQLRIGVNAQLELDAAEGKVAIDLSASFIQEVALDPQIKASVVKKKILFVKIPIGVQLNANIDLKNYTALSFAAEIYTVAPEEQKTWDKFKNILKDPTNITGLPGIPASVTKGLKNVGDAIDKIEELQAKIDKAKESADKLKGYAQDIQSLWKAVEKTGVTTQKDYQSMANALGKTSIVSDLMGLMNMSDSDEEVESAYLESVQALMNKYTEMIQKETDWITIVEKEMFTTEVNYFGLCAGVTGKFVVRMDMSIALGSSLEYEVGKRYSFWFKIGLFKPSSGSSTMDILDEKFAFQFYVMGRIGVKAGVRAKVYVGIGSGKFCSVGMALELGPYAKIYGFFIYEYSKLRPANTQNWIYDERMAGGVFFEFGLYTILSFEANAIGNLFEYSKDFINKEFPLLTAGKSRFYYDTAYVVEEGETLRLKDEDNKASNGISMSLPKSTLALSYVDLKTGVQGTESLNQNQYNISLSNKYFKYNKSTGKITVNVPEGVHYLECDLKVTYKNSKIAFSNYDMSVTIPMVWTDLTDAQLNEYHTASLQVGNPDDGFETIWTKKVRIGEQFNLPKVDEIKSLMGWSDMKYQESTGYNGQPTTQVTLQKDTTYTYNIAYKEYSVIVDNIQNSDGTTSSKEFKAKYGHTFDFSSLENTGTNKTGTYTRFSEVTSPVVDLTQPLNETMIEKLIQFPHVQANYVDNSVKVTYEFSGIIKDSIEQMIKKGTTPNFESIRKEIESQDYTIQSIYPAIGVVNDATVYQVVCKRNKKDVDIQFESNGGSDINTITKLEGDTIGDLLKPSKDGYVFNGWYYDNELNNAVESTDIVPVGGMTLYAKWTPITYTITYEYNGGSLPTGTNPTKYTIESDDIKLFNPSRVGYTFIGWKEGNNNPLNPLIIANGTIGDKTYKAIWKANTYTVTFETNGGTVSPTTKEVTYDSTYGELPIPTKDGYTFMGWYTSQTGGSQIHKTNVVKITSHQTLYANWTKKIVATFNGNGGSDGQSIARDKGEALGTLPTSTRAGYKFEGWYTEQSGGTKITESTLMPTSNVTYYAHWTLVNYTITYNLNGGSMSEEKTSYNIETADYTLPTPTRNAYEFSGWYTASDFSGTALTQISQGSAGNKTFYAKWTPKTYEITYNLDGSSMSGQKTSYTIETDSFTLPTPTKTGYTFLGWTGSNGTTPQTSVSIVKGSVDNKTYTAHWKVNSYTYTIQYVSSSEKVLGTSSVTFNYGTTNTISPKAFTGYDSPANQSVTWNSITSKTITFIYEPKIYTISWTLNSGTLSDQKTSYTIETADYTLPIPTRNDYTFDGWYTTSDFSDTAVTEITTGSTDNKTFYAKWTHISYVPETNWSNNADTSWYDSSKSTFEISNASQLAGLAKLVNDGITRFEGKTVNLTADINLSQHQWIPIGMLTSVPDSESRMFIGRFDGQNHTISGIKINSTTNYAGLFGVLGTAYVENINIENSYINSMDYVGAVAGQCYNYGWYVDQVTPGTLKNCTVKNSTIIGNKNVGGITGYLEGGILENCVNYAAVTSNCQGVANEEPTVLVEYGTGGIVGQTYGKNDNRVRNCMNYGKVKGYCNTGGISGYTHGIDSQIINCANFGQVTGLTKCAGGITGATYIIDKEQDLTEEHKTAIYNCYNVGDVTGTTAYTGAIVGRNTYDKGKVYYCYYKYESALANGAIAVAAGNKENTFKVENDNQSEKGRKCTHFEVTADTIGNLNVSLYDGQTTLLGSLNSWVNGKNEYVTWIINNESIYPVLNYNSTQQ